jgi:hypothetical protein
MMRNLPALLAVPLALSLLTQACGGDIPSSSSTGASREIGIEEPLDDSRINSAVQSKVFASDGLSSRNVEVTTRDGVVTLKGFVESQEVKQTALTVAAEAEGVARVEDQLTIDPGWRARLDPDSQDSVPTTGRDEEQPRPAR